MSELKDCPYLSLVK